MRNLLNHKFLSSIYTLLFLVSANWFLPIFNSLLSETDFASRVEIIAYLSVILSLQLVACFLITRYYTGFGAKRIHTATLALFFTINLLGLLLSFHNPFLNQPSIDKTIEVLLLFAGFFWFISILNIKKAVIGGLTLLYALMTIQQIFALTIANDTTPSPLDEPFKTIKFERTPNVYFLSFDSLMPPSITSKFLGLEVLDYITVLDQFGARRFPNTFSDRDTTLTSLNATLFLNSADGTENKYARNLAFSGVAPSPVFNIFRANGYDITTAYAGEYKLRGKYIDRFISRNVSKSYCEFALPWHYFQHLGYCSFKLNVLIPLSVGDAHQESSLEEQILNHITNINPVDGPLLNYIYIYKPGHTPLNYADSPEERRKYSQFFDKSQKQISTFIQETLKQISTKDPSAIILIFGDHGAWISRAMNFNDQTAEFIIQDRHAVVSALYPPDTCSAYMGAQDGETFTTPSKLIRQLIICLSGGKDPINHSVDYSGPYEGYPFGDYLYE